MYTVQRKRHNFKLSLFSTIFPSPTTEHRLTSSVQIHRAIVTKSISCVLAFPLLSLSTMSNCFENLWKGEVRGRYSQRYSLASSNLFPHFLYKHGMRIKFPKGQLKTFMLISDPKPPFGIENRFELYKPPR